MQQALIDKGVLRPSGEIVKDNINLISGTHTPPFVEMLWMVTNGETVTTNRVYTLLSGLYADEMCIRDRRDADHHGLPDDVHDVHHDPKSHCIHQPCGGGPTDKIQHYRRKANLMPG